MATTFTYTLPEGLEEWVTEMFFQKGKSRRLGAIYPKICDVRSSNRAREEAFEVFGLGTFALKAEGTAVSYDAPVQGNRASIYMQTYARGYRVTKEMQEDERHDIIGKLPGELADAAADHKERLAHQPWNAAFVTTTFTTLDAAALVSTSHTAGKTGGSRSNRLSPDLDLSHEGLEAILNQATLFISHEGRQLNYSVSEAKTLLFHPNLQHEATRLLETEYQPGSNENDINTMRSSRNGVTPLPDPYLSDQQDWFLIFGGADKPIVFDRVGLSQSTGTDFDTGDMKHFGRYRAGVGTWAYDGVFGSSPA